MVFYVKNLKKIYDIISDDGFDDNTEVNININNFGINISAEKGDLHKSIIIPNSKIDENKKIK